MFKILERHIAKTILVATLMATGIVIAILFLLLVLGELKNIGEGDYSIFQAILYVLLRMPNEVYQFFPMLILIGSMIGLSVLSLQRELVVMRASGFSIRNIIVSVLSAGLLLTLTATFLGEWFGPGLSYKAEIRKENAQNAGQAVVTASGVWFHIDNNFIHIQRVVDRQLLEGVTRYEFDDHRHLQAAYYAKTLTENKNKWTMNSVVKTTFYNERTNSQQFAELPWDIKLNTNLLNMGLVDPNEMSLPKLVKFSRYLQQNGLQADEYQYNFWQRIFQPLGSLVMIFLAIPFILGAYGRSTLGWRVLVGVLIGFGFFISNAFLVQLSIVYQIPTFFAAALPLVLFSLLGLWLMNKIIKT